MLRISGPRRSKFRTPIGSIDPPQNLVEILRWRAKYQSDAVAFRFLPNGEAEAESITYASFDQRAAALAASMQAEGLCGERVLLCYQTEPELLIAVLACLYSGVIAIPTSLPRPHRRNAHLTSIADDAQPRAILTTNELMNRRADCFDEIRSRPGIRMLPTDTMIRSRDSWEPAIVDPETTAYLQYTSGSTHHPKGVMITHRNISANCSALAEVVGEGPHVGVGWLPFFHDMGLVGTLFLPLWMGFPHVFMSPESFLMKPVRWLQAISRYRATVSPAPNFAYDFCAQRITKSQVTDVDLSSWQIAFNGAERIDTGTMDRFTRKFQSCGFRSTTFLPCYGLAESTLIVTGDRAGLTPVVQSFHRSKLHAGEAIRDDQGIPLVSCGRPVKLSEVVIVDPETLKPCDPGNVGEIWVSGPSVAAGYWRNPEATSATFSECLSVMPGSTCSRTGASRTAFLRTGDLGFVFDGQLFVTGRIKDLIIIAGRNIASEDIEMAVESAHPAIEVGGAIAFADGTPCECVVVVAEVHRHNAKTVDPVEIERAIRKAVAIQNDVTVEHIMLIKKGRLPRTANGKKARAACRSEFVLEE